MANSITHFLDYPIANARYSLPLSFRVAAGTPTDPTTPDTEFSVDGGASFSDCAEEVTTGGGNGMGYLTLTGAETNTRMLLIAAKSANCLTTPAILQPRVLPILSSGTLSAGSSTGGTLGTVLAYDITGCYIRTTGGTGGGGTGGANNQARRIITYNVSTGAFTCSTWGTTPSTDTTYDILLPEGATFGAVKAVNPTTPGRTLDVSAGGEAGLDWANVGSPTTTVDLTGTTISTSQVVASVSGAVGSVTGNVGGNVVGSVASVVGAVGSVTGNVGGNVVGSVASVVGAVGSVTGAVGSVTGNVGGNVVGSTASVVGNVGGNVTGTVGGITGTISISTFDVSGAMTITGGIISDITGNLSGSVGSVTGAVGSVTGSVGSVTAGVTVSTNNDKTGYSLTATTGLGNQTANITGTITTATNVTTVNGLAANVITAAAIAADATSEIAGAVWDETLAGHLGAGSTGAALNAAGSAGDPWTTTLPGAYTGSQAGKILSDILLDTGTDGVVVAAGSKTGYSLTATTGLGNQTANITGNLSGSVGSVTGTVTVGTNNDKTGYSLTQSFPANFATLSIDGNGIVTANVVQVNDVDLTGIGTIGDPWGPA